MTEKTEHLGLTKLGPGDTIHSDGGRFGYADRDIIDQELYRLSVHRHVGGAAAANAPENAPALSVGTGGTVPAGSTLRYKYTYVDPSAGESTASPEESIVVGDAIAEPPAPTFTLQSIGGTLEPGQHFYAASVYQGSSTVETKAVNPVSVSIPAGTLTNQVELTLAALPSGATGYNIYRLAPNETRYSHIGTTTTASFVDAGIESTLRTLPSQNTTGGDNSVTVEIDSVPADNNWRIYRTYTDDWTNSFLVEVPSGGATPILSYTDTGSGTTFGSPPDAGFGSQPSKIDLASEVQGTLPISSGGTGGATAEEARDSLGLEIGVDVQSYDGAVRVDGDQVIAGTKEFASKIVVPVPVDGNEAVPKSYVDSLGSGITEDPTDPGLYLISGAGASAGDLDGGDASTAIFDNTVDGGIASTITFDATYDGGTSG